MKSQFPCPFQLDELAVIEAGFASAIREGLRHDHRQIRALPAFVGPPPPSLSGSALVLDTGGTNMRAALVHFADDRRIEIEGPVERSLRERATRPLARSEFFGMHAELAEELGAPRGLPVGYCFSYPSEAQPGGDARLISWTKGLAVEGVEGSLVGEGLLTALAARGFEPRSVFVLNDTVAALLGGAATARGADTKHIGLIVGTGTNMASFFDAEEAPKLVGWGRGPMAVNLESGNFNPPNLSALDETLAEEAEPRGQQRFEKAVSGLYLPELYARARPEDAAWARGAGARGLVERASTGVDPGASLAWDLLLRSAQLVAVGLSAVARVHHAPGTVQVLAEGSLFWGWAGYRTEVERVLAASNPSNAFEIRRMENANLVGAACAALASRSGSVERPPN